MAGFEARLRSVLGYPAFHPLAVSFWLIPLFVLGLSWVMRGDATLFRYSGVCVLSLRGLGGVGLVAVFWAAGMWPAMAVLVFSKRLDQPLHRLGLRGFAGRFSRSELTAVCRQVRFRDILAMSLSTLVSFYLVMGPGSFCGEAG